MSRQCTNCGAELTNDMISAKMCFECGEEIPADQSEIATVLECNNNKFTINTVDESKLTSRQYEVITFLTKYLLLFKDFKTEKNYYEIYLKKINSASDCIYLSTLRNNTELFYKAFENVESMIPLEKGERFFLFCSMEKYTAMYGINQLASRGYFVTSRRMLFKKDNEFTSLPIQDIDSLTVDLDLDLWCLNGSEKFTVSSEWYNSPELSLILAFIFSIVTDDIDAPKEQKKTEEPPSKIQHQENAISSSTKDKLREAKTLFEEGLIEESEYTELRKKLLDKFIRQRSEY